MKNSRYSIRLLLLVFSLLCVIMALVVRPALSLGQQLTKNKIAVATVKRHGTALGDFTWDGPVPLLHGFLPPDYYLQVGGAELKPATSDDDLAELVPHLKAFNDFRFLTLAETAITNVGLEHLQGLDSLTRLDLRDTNTTSAGVDRLRIVLPNCKIITDSPAAAGSPDVPAAT